MTAVDGRRDVDVVVVGGGHNGLVCAAYLARAGLAVEVLEQAATPGGAIFGDDHTADGGARLELGAVEHTTILGSSVLDDLALADHGLRYRRRRVAGLHLFGDGRHVTIAGTAEATAESIAALDPHDADAWLELTRLAATMGRALGALSSGLVPSASTVRAMGRLALGRRGADVVELASCSALDLAERWFRSDHLRAVVVARAQVAGLPPWYPGTGAVFCFTPAGHGRDLGRPVGGGPAFVRALVAAVTAAGGRVRTGARVSGLAPDGDGWVVTVEGGERRRARAVVAAVPPHHTVLRLLPADVVPVRLRESFERATVVGGNVSQATVAAHLAARPPVPHAPDDDHAGAMLWLAPRPADCLDGYAAAFAGALAARPTLAFTFPSVLDPTAAPPGEATVWANSFVAHRLQAGGDGGAGDIGWAEAGPTLAARVWETVAACLGAPVAPLVRRQVVTTPADLTARTGAENPGNHVAPTLEQSLGWRPVRGLGGHRTPWPGLYLSGAGTHPGGSVSGEPGRLAARAVLADLTATRAQRLRAGGADAWSQLARTLGAVRAGRARGPGA